MRKANCDLQLTHRELQILALVAQGFSAKEVAQSIAIAPRTVEGHIDTIRLKLQARNRAHMVAKAMAAKLVDVDGLPSPLPGEAKDQPMDLHVPEQSLFDESVQPLLTLVSRPSSPPDFGNLGCATQG